ncbi:MAG: hypothetical protein JW841_04855 [Deltaproteobacteria bacterium]|nr:hypothetical protein [Deltaproteobacteria bacterium]
MFATNTRFTTFAKALVVSVSCLATVNINSALAFTPTAYFLLQQLAQKRQSLNARDISAQFRTEIAGVDVPIEEYLYLKYPERMRLISQYDHGEVIYIEREGKRVMQTEQQVKKLTNAIDLTASLLVAAGKDIDQKAVRMLKALKAAGIDTSIVAYGHLDDTIAYVIGARPFETDKPQVWLNQDTLQLLKTIIIDKEKPKAVVEMRFLDYGSPTGGDFLPAVIEVYRDGKLVRRAELSSLAINRSLPETLFDLPRLR